MAISEKAQQKHDELFPGHVSSLKDSDPELIEYFDNFAFDEVLRHGNLDTRTRLMVQLASMIACQALGEYRVMLGAALTVGVAPVEVKEIVYHAVPYVGMLQVNGNVTTEPLDERGPLLGSPEQVAADLDQAAELGVEHVYWNSNDDPLSQLPLLAELRSG